MEKNSEGGYTIEHGGIVQEGEASEKFSNFPTPLLTTPKKRVKRVDGRTLLGQALKAKEGKVRIKPRHRAILKAMEATGGIVTPAMIALSYSDSTCRNPKLITKSKSWKALMDEQLPEDKIARVHSELLDKRARRNIRDENGKIIQYDVDDGPDTAAVSKGLELAYKLRGAFKESAPVAKAATTYNLFYQPGVQQSTKTFEQALIKQIRDGATKQNIRDIGEASPNQGQSDDRGDQEGADGTGGGETA